MNKKELLYKIDKFLELEVGTLTGEEKIASLSGWDSLVILEFITFADQEFSLIISPKDIYYAKTVNDLIKLFGDKIKDI